MSAAAGAETEDEELARRLQAQILSEDAEREKRDWEYAQALHEKETGHTATDFECVICLNDFSGSKDLNKGVVTACGHRFCVKCFLQFTDTREAEIRALCLKPRAGQVEKDIKCPLCRTSILADCNRVRRMHSRPPVSIPDTPPLGRTGGRSAANQPLPWDPSTTIIVQCPRCNQRLFAPPGRPVKCVCNNIIPPQNQRGNEHWRAESQVLSRSELPPDQQLITIVLCPSCRNHFSARRGETVRCRCGTGLFVPGNAPAAAQPAGPAVAAGNAAGRR